MFSKKSQDMTDYMCSTVCSNASIVRRTVCPCAVWCIWRGDFSQVSGFSFVAPDVTHWDAPAFTVKARTRCPALHAISPHLTPTHIHTHTTSLFFLFNKKMSNQRLPGWPSRSHGQNYNDGSYAASAATAASAAPRDAPTAPYYDQYAASNDAYDRRGPAPGIRGGYRGRGGPAPGIRGGYRDQTPGPRGGQEEGEHAASSFGASRLHYLAEYYREPESPYTTPDELQSVRIKDAGSGTLCARCGESKMDGHRNPNCERPCCRCPDSPHDSIVSPNYHVEFKANE